MLVRYFYAGKTKLRAYCSLRNEMGRNEMEICSLRNGNLYFAKWKSVVCEMRICSLRKLQILADQAIDIRKRFGCSRYTQSCGPSSHCCYGLVCTRGNCDRKPCLPKDGECVTSLDCCGRLVCWTRAQSWEGSRCGERP